MGCTSVTKVIPEDEIYLKVSPPACNRNLSIVLSQCSLIFYDKNMKHSRRLQFLATGIVCALTTVGAQPAEAAILSWSLTFTAGGNQVGTGEFSYDDEKVAVVRTPPRAFSDSDIYIAGQDDPIRPDFLFPPFPITKYPNPLVNFVANLPGKQWTLNFASWWAPAGPGSLLGSFQCGRSGCGVADQWFGGSTLGLAPGQFAMWGGTPVADDTYTGTFASRPVPSTNSPLFGTWTATAVPEPTTMAGAVMFGVSWLLAKKQRSR
jgi:hypothetical protein